MFRSKLLASKITAPVSSLFQRAKHHLQRNIFHEIIPKTIPVIEKFDFTDLASPEYRTKVSKIVSTFNMFDPVTKIPSANKKGSQCCPNDYFLLDYMVMDDEGEKKDFQVLYDRMSADPLGVVVGSVLFGMQEFNVPMALLPSYIKELQPTESNLGSLVPSSRRDVRFSSVYIRRALITLSQGYSRSNLYNWNQALKVLLTISTDGFRFSTAREFTADCLKLGEEDAVQISPEMEIITSNWDSISKRMWASEYPFNFSGKVSIDSKGPFTKDLACVVVSLLTSDEKAKANEKPKPDYDGSRRKKGMAFLAKFGKKKKEECSSGSSISTEDVAAGMARLREYWKSSDSENLDGADEVSAAGNELNEIREVVD